MPKVVFLSVGSKAASSDIMLWQGLARARWLNVVLCMAQILERGFHHADPHPGNLLRLPDNRLAYIDFGMMGDIQTGVRQYAFNLCFLRHVLTTLKRL